MAEGGGPERALQVGGHSRRGYHHNRRSGRPEEPPLLRRQGMGRGKRIMAYRAWRALRGHRPAGRLEPVEPCATRRLWGLRYSKDAYRHRLQGGRGL